MWMEPSRIAAPAQPRQAGSAFRRWALPGGAALYVLLVSVGLYGLGGAFGRASRPEGNRVYSVAAVDEQLAGDASGWSGRIVHVRAIAEPCQAWGSPSDTLQCRTFQPQLVDYFDSGLENPLPLTIPAKNPLLTMLRRVPLLRGLAPAPQVLQWGEAATYLVRLQVMPGSACGIARCFQAVLQNAAP